MQDCIIPLKQCNDDILQIKDFDIIIIYKRILDPDNKKTTSWTVHYKNDGDLEWKTINECITSKYCIVKTENILKHIQTIIGGKVLEQKVKRFHTYIKILFLMDGFNLDPQPVTSADRVLFKIITGHEIKDLNSLRTLSFCLINGLAGDFALTLYYAISFLFRGIKDDKVIKMSTNNLFILNEFAYRIVHGNEMSLDFMKPDLVKSQVQRCIDEYKNINVDIKFINTITKTFPLKFSREFFIIFDALPKEHANMYYATIILSHLCNLTRQVYLELRIRSFLINYLSMYKAGSFRRGYKRYEQIR
jgi:hypothetical protein